MGGEGVRHRIVGVDPGAPLALALLGHNGALLATATRDTIAIQKGSSWENSPELVARVLNEWGEHAELTYCIEATGSRPFEGSVSVAKYIGSAWLVRGIAAAQGNRAVTVAPSKWKADFNLRGGVENKDLSRARAAQLWPKKAARFKRKMDNDVAEAALIAYWKWLQIKQHGVMA